METKSSVLEGRLNAHFATLTPAALAQALKNGRSQWPMYAAVAGSALAMATNASAGEIYSNATVAVGPHFSQMGQGQFTVSSPVPLKTASGANAGFAFNVGIFQNVTSQGNRSGSAFVKDSSRNRLLFRDTNQGGKLRKFSSGNKISAGLGGPAGTWEAGNVKLFSRLITGGGGTPGNGWAASQPGFAGFEVSTAGHKLEYGWVRLAFIEGQGGLPIGIEAIDWAYDPSGAPVTVGQLPSSTPEPATGALALLAAGAAGVTALRRRRQSAA